LEKTGAVYIGVLRYALLYRDFKMSLRKDAELTMDKPDLNYDYMTLDVYFASVAGVETRRIYAEGM
jgi:hypothetical protein